MMQILIGEISSYKAIIIASFLKQNYPDIHIVSYDFKQFTRKIHTRFIDEHIIVSNANQLTYLEELSGICQHHQIDYFFPVHSDMIGKILERKELFGHTLDYLGDYSDYSQLHHKNLLNSISIALGIEVPKAFIDLKKSQIPFVAKPKNQSSSRGVKYILSESDRKSVAMKLSPDYIFQEYINGFGCGYSVYVKNGEIKAGYGHKRLAEYPVSGGSSVYRQSFNDERMLNVANKIFGKIKWTGFAMLEFKYTPDHRLVLIEINPRIWGSINQGLQNGVNYFEPILGEVKLKKSTQIYTYLPPLIYISLLKNLLRLKFLPTHTFIKNVMKNKADINVFSDPKAWLSVVLRKVLS